MSAADRVLVQDALRMLWKHHISGFSNPMCFFPFEDEGIFDPAGHVLYSDHDVCDAECRDLGVVATTSSSEAEKHAERLGRGYHTLLASAVGYGESIELVVFCDYSENDYGVAPFFIRRGEDGLPYFAILAGVQISEWNRYRERWGLPF